MEFALIWWNKPSGISYLHLHQDWVITDMLWYLICVSDSVGPWLPWAQWSMCSVSCGGGQQHRSRICSLPPCSSVSRQSKTCNTQVCLGKFRFALGGGQYLFWFYFHYWTHGKVVITSFLTWLSEVGCPPGRLYRECERGEGCPFNCAQVSLREGCYSDGCEEGCHCPPHTYQHNGVCLQVGFHLCQINIILHYII